MRGFASGAEGCRGRELWSRAGMGRQVGQESCAGQEREEGEMGPTRSLAVQGLNFEPE